MKNWLETMGRKFNQWMIGRYGTDELSRMLIFISIVLLLLTYIPIKGFRFFSAFAWILLIWAYYRCLSRNVIARNKERETYMRLTGGLRRKMAVYKRMWSDRKTHRYYKCPSCKTMIRVPKGRGKIIITCTKCKNEITKTT